MTSAPRALLLSDESLSGHVVHGLRRHHPEIDLLVAVEQGLESWPDPAVLEWASGRGRAVVAQDKRTMVGFARRRMADGRRFPGLIVVPEKLPIGRAIGDIATLVGRSNEEPLEGRIVHLPLDKAWRVSEDVPEWATAGA